MPVNAEAFFPESPEERRTPIAPLEKSVAPNSIFGVSISSTKTRMEVPSATTRSKCGLSALVLGTGKTSLFTLARYRVDTKLT
jgi:hypothetical protein